jgi:rod shape-determining protein MreC
VNKSFSGVNNFLTLDKGSSDGVKPDMGVISQNGIVGVIFSVSSHFSVVIPIVNPKFRISAKIKKSENSGSLCWNGPDLNIAQLEQLPKHEPFHPGDTVVTSFSHIFPKDLIIGFVASIGRSKDDNFNMFNVRLATDFHSLEHVLVIRDKLYEEQSQLEASINKP